MQSEQMVAELQSELEVARKEIARYEQLESAMAEQCGRAEEVVKEAADLRRRVAELERMRDYSECSALASASRETVEHLRHVEARCQALELQNRDLRERERNEQLLVEKLDMAHAQLRRSEDRLREYEAMKIEMASLREMQMQWEAASAVGPSTIQGPAEMRRTIAELRAMHAVAEAERGRATSESHRLSAECERLRGELEQLRAAHATLMRERQQDADARTLLTHQLQVVTKERDALLQLCETYGSEQRSVIEATAEQKVRWLVVREHPCDSLCSAAASAI